MLLLAVTLDSRVARADPELFVDLVYQLDAVPSGCPGEAEFRAMISDQLGYDPFRAGAEEKVVARAQAAPHGLRGFVEWYDASGAPRGERELGSESTDCGALARAMSFAIAVQIQLLTQEAEAREARSSKEAASDEPFHATNAKAPPIAPPNRAGHADRSTREARSEDPAEWQFMLGAGPTLAFGLAPRTAIEGRVLAGARRGRLGTELAGEASLPSRYVSSNGDGFDQRVVAGSVAGCTFSRTFSGCVVGKLGRLTVRGFGVDVPNSASGTLAQIGPRLTLNQTIGERWFGALRVEALATLVHWEVRLNRREVWETPILCLSVGGDLGMIFQ